MTTTFLGPQALWFLTRASGLVLLVLLTATVVLGVLGPVRFRLPRWPSFLTTAVHRDLSLLAVALLALHVVTTVADGYAPIRWRDAVLPFGSAYRPVWLGLGALALDLLLALVVTSLLRGRIGYRTWRTVHWAAYATWPVALLHAFGTGTDVRRPAVLALTGLCAFAVVGAVTWRTVGGPVRSPRVRAAGALATLLAPALFAAWAVQGPLAPGWSRRAGTPPPATAAAVQDPTADRPPPPATLAVAPAAFAVPLHARVDGTLTRRQLAGGVTRLDLTGVLSGAAGGSLRLIVDGRGSPATRLVPASGGVLVGPLGDPGRLHGGVVTVARDTFALRLWDRAGRRVDATLRIALSADGTRFAGLLDATVHHDPVPPAVNAAAPARPQPVAGTTATMTTTTTPPVGDDGGAEGGDQ